MRPPLVWSLLKLQAGGMRLARVCCSCTASAGRLLPALLAVRACCSGGHHGMAVWPESGKIGIDLSSMTVTEVSRVDLTVYGGAGAGHWPRFRPRQIGPRNPDVRGGASAPPLCLRIRLTQAKSLHTAPIPSARCLSWPEPVTPPCRSDHQTSMLHGPWRAAQTR